MQAIAVTDGRRAKGARGISLETGMGRSGCNSARRNRPNRRARNGPCQRTRIHTVVTGVIDNSPAPSRLVNADALGEELKFYPRRPRLKSVRPDQAGHFATHTEGLFRVMYGRRPRCKRNLTISEAFGCGHVWTAPAMQEESDYQRSVRVRSCIRPLSAAVWPLALM